MIKKSIDIIYIVFFNHEILKKSLLSLTEFFYGSDYSINVVFNFYNPFTSKLRLYT